ncbi:MAG TPA: aa3-type cytochrome c oxidase subunit IV [Micropepsaceae bacterium]|nr:aa3-type cytochrome c oxidase subunit IV [Micropepsaceae bacterium]
MAEHHHPSGDSSTGGSMDITEHVKTWLAFWNTAKWGTVALIVLAALLFIFRTHNG